MPAPTRIPAPPGPRTFAAFALAIALPWLASLGLRSLSGSDEGRYADLALSMLQGGDWITPRLNGLLYFEKPPLVYWAGALSYALVGVNEFAARLWPGLAGLGCVAAVGWAAAAWWGRAAALRAAALCASMTWLTVNSHLLTLDTSLCFGVTLALAGLLRGFAPGTEARARRRALLVAWFGMALATLSKGPVGVLIPGGALVVYTVTALLRGEGAQAAVLWRSLEWARGLALYATLTLPWFVAVSMRNPGFAEFFFVHEHWVRYTSSAHRREGGWGYFVPIVVAGAFPWTGLLAAAALRALRSTLSKRPVRADRAPPPALRPGALLWCWCGFVFAFFSASGSKLPSYVLPMFPALALLGAADLVGRERLRPLLGPIGWVGALGLWLVADRFGARDAPPEAIRSLLVHVSAGAVLFVAGWAVAWRLDAAGRLTAAIATLAVAHVVAALVTLTGHDAYGQLKSAARIAPLIRAAVPADAPVFSVRYHDHTLPFYLRRPVLLVEHVDEFEFGQNAEPERWIPTSDEFVERWRALSAAAAIMGADTFEVLRQQGVPMREIHRDARRVVVLRN